MFKTVLASVLLAFSLGSSAYAFTLQDAKRTQGVYVSPDQTSTHELVHLKGPGKFVAAEVSKQGGTDDMTFVNLIVDGQPLVSTSIVAARNVGFGADNLFGIKLLDAPSGIKNLTIGFGGLIEFKSDLILSVQVREPSVVQIIGNVISGK